MLYKLTEGKLYKGFLFEYAVAVCGVWGGEGWMVGIGVLTIIMLMTGKIDI